MLGDPIPRSRRSTLRLLLVLAALLGVAAGGAATLSRGAAPAPVGAPVASAGPHADGLAAKDEAPPRAGEAPEGEYRLDRLPVFSYVVEQVAQQYVDPRRIDPRAMFLAALDQVERTVAEVMVEGDGSTGKVKVTVGAQSREFPVPEGALVYRITPAMRDVMSFVQKHLVAKHDLRQIEFAAANGMLSTLDPHSLLLEPRQAKDMKIQTRGEFGGLGFVISMREGNLTVVRVLKNTPAQRAGIKAKDVVVKIEEQSTINMDLQEAVDRLRGKPHTKVAITVSRAGWPEPRRMVIMREIITVESVPHAKLLEGGIGYVKVQGFAANTTREIVAALQRERAEAGGPLKGLVLDLRNNPGGLLEQAIQVADLFLSEGLIVKTVGGNDRVFEVKEARPDPGDMTQLPLAILVNNQSASASEIVAGALRGNGRAVVLGRQTFGKGSVQVLFEYPDPRGDPPSLKLTIAQYLTPGEAGQGDLSIQEVGITPDVLLLPGRALEEAVNAFAPPRLFGEADLERHLANGRGALAPKDAPRAERLRQREKAPLELRYLLEEKEDQVARALRAEQRRAKAKPRGEVPELTPEQQEDDEAEANPEELVEDYQIRLARELLARFPYPDRARQLEGARLLVAERRQQEEARLRSRLERLGLDWSSGPAEGAPRALVTVTPPPGRRLEAGESASWSVTVENRGDGPFHRLRAWSLVEKNPLLDRREFVFGLIRPGERRSWTVPLKVPQDLDSRRDEVTLHFDEENGRAPPDFTTTLDFVERPRPLFAFSTQVEDEAGGNGDGLVQRGEELTLRVDVKNQGQGTSSERTYVSVKNLGDEKVFIKKGRATLGALKPGESKTAALQIEVKRGLKPDKLALQVLVADEKLDEYVAEKIDLPVAGEAVARAPAPGAVRVAGGEAVLRAGASASAPPVGLARRGVVIPASARFGEFYRVEWQKGRAGFVSAAEVQAAGRARREGTASPVWQREPPRITLAPDPARGAPVVDGERLRIEGSAQLPAGALTRLRDVFIYLNDQKVFFKVLPEADASSRMDFATELPLKPGNNVVTVFAREDEDFQSRRTVVVHRRSPAEVAAKP